MKKALFISVVALALAIVLAGAASAASIDISTGVANWQVTQIPVGAPGSTGPAVVLTAHPGWNHSLESDTVRWVGASEDGNLRGLAGDYVYQLALDLSAGHYLLNAKFTADNFVTSFKFGGNELLAAPQSDPYSFQMVFDVNGQSSYRPILTVVVHNDTYSVGQSLDNPTGLIIGGSVTTTAVPVPAAGWAGMALMGGLGAIRTWRRRMA